jgi:predicted transcriptional regulator
LLQKHDDAMRVTAKEKAGRSHHPDRDTQVRSMEAPQQAFAAAGCPIISVDTKQKELIGNFKHAGQAWGQQAEEVNGHNFLTAALGRAAPYGIFAPQRHEGAVSVGSSADTAEFAVTAIAHGWADSRRQAYPQARHLQ